MARLQQIHDAAQNMESDLAIPPVTDKEELMGRIAESVTAEDTRTLQAYILEQRLPDPNQFWELTTMMAPCLSAKNLTDNPQFFTTIRRCLTYFSRHGKPKEMVLAFLENLEGFHEDAKFITLLPCLQNALLQLPVKRGRSLELALDTLGCHIVTMPAPQNSNLEGEELKLLEMDETVRRFLDVVPAFLEFMQPFLESGGAGEKDGSGRQWELRVMKKHLLRLLQHPLSFLDLRFNAKEQTPKSYGREIAENVVRCLSVLEKNFYRLLIQNPAEGVAAFSDDAEKKREDSPSKEDIEDNDMEEENLENERRASRREGRKEEEEGKGEVELSRLSAACLLYLVEVEGLGQSSWPSVISPQYLLHSALPHAHLLLTHPTYTTLHKGLALLTFHLDLLPRSALPRDFLDNEKAMPVVNALVAAMTSCPVRELRAASLSVFRSLFPCLVCAGRYQLMKSVLSSCQHAGVKAVVVGMVKDEIDAAFKDIQNLRGNGDRIKPEIEESAALVKNQQQGAKPVLSTTTVAGNVSDGDRLWAELSDDAAESTNSGAPFSDGRERPQYFFKDRLRHLLTLATALPDGAASDLLQVSDLVMATLNLLRYLVLRDPAHVNHTGVWGMREWLEKGYLSQLRVGLDMSVGHYRLELDSIDEDRGKRKGPEIEATLTVAGSTLPAMTRDQRVGVMNSALTTFDMMKCVLARLCELMDQKGKDS